ncbi:MAG: riboflavin biosynthesis protein RibF [Clostridiales bacterium]|nr:riboflavin biosynthesis protein RibF [Clostridiales bacterium]
MKQIQQQKTAVALGSFDGVHLGHRAVLSGAVREGYQGVACLINPDYTLATPAVARMHLERLGLRVEEPDFAAIRGLTGREFVHTYLKEALHAGLVSCGADFRFGAGAACGLAELQAYCEAAGITVAVADEVCYAGQRISSTRIRQAVTAGELSLANAMLGYPFTYDAEVVRGDMRGRTIDFPTINQRFDSRLCVPKYGVYASSVLVDGREYPAMTNIGIRPTYALEQPLSETHIIGCRGDLYAKRIPVSLLAYLRPERRFASLEDLKRQLSSDIRKAETVYHDRAYQRGAVRF